MANGYLAHRILNSISSAPVIWSGGRDVVQITFEKSEYDELLKFLSEAENDFIKPVEYHRTKI